MKPQTAAFLGAADRALAHAIANLGINIPDQAARLAYHAQFHAAQALIFERTDKISRQHKGVSKEFHRIARSEAGLPPGAAASLSKAYRYKEIADYDVGTVVPITYARARDAIATAESFVGAVRDVLT